MKITHLSNSFIIIESNGIKICCDPWVGRANYGGWQSFPEFNIEELKSQLKDVDYVYISHIHDDHFDTDFLVQSGLFEKQFLIKKFNFKTLYKRLKSIGTSQIIELDPFEIFKINNIKLSILPQLSSNSSEIDEDVEYDIDTSIIISDGENVFFNQVDNPYSSNDYKELYTWIENNYGKITVAALMAGAASEYPHRFLNIDKEIEKQKIINNVLSKLVEKINILKPIYYFPAGGTYFIPGKFHILNHLIAQPTLNEIEKVIETNHVNVKITHLEGGKCILLQNGNTVIQQEIKPFCEDMSKSISEHKNDLYDYELEELNISFNRLEEIFALAKNNWIQVIAEKNIEIEQDIKFLVYSNLLINQNLKEVVGKNIGTLELHSNLMEKKGELKVYIDIRSMYLCLIRRKVWNGTIGALCLFERFPNEFYPSVTFSLNYLTTNEYNK